MGPKATLINGTPPLQCAPPSVWHLNEFVSKEEEAAIIGCVDAMETSGWVTVDGRRVQRMGGHPEAPPARMIPEAMCVILRSNCC